MLIKKLAVVMLALLTISSIACARIIPVKLELPKKPTYSHEISKGVEAIYNTTDSLIYYKVTIGSMNRIAKNKALCREDNQTLRSIIKTTH